MPMPLDDVDIYISVKLHILCEKCKAIRSWLKINPFPVGHQVKPHQLKHYGSVHQLAKSYLQGCHFGALIWASIVENGPPHERSCHARGKKGSRPKLFRRKGDAVTVIARKSIDFSGPTKTSIDI
jgi:hypothetical protein